MTKFIISVRQADGSEYEPFYLRGMIGSFERYLKRHQYEPSLIKGVEFNRLKKALKSKQKDLKNKKVINQWLLRKLIFYEKKFIMTGYTIINHNTMWFNNTLFI